MLDHFSLRTSSEVVFSLGSECPLDDYPDCSIAKKKIKAQFSWMSSQNHILLQWQEVRAWKQLLGQLMSLLSIRCDVVRCTILEDRKYLVTNAHSHHVNQKAWFGVRQKEQAKKDAVTEA